jgi:hypothetical protein
MMKTGVVYIAKLSFSPSCKLIFRHYPKTINAVGWAEQSEAHRGWAATP